MPLTNFLTICFKGNLKIFLTHNTFTVVEYIIFAMHGYFGEKITKWWWGLVGQNK